MSEPAPKAESMEGTTSEHVQRLRRVGAARPPSAQRGFGFWARRAVLWLFALGIAGAIVKAWLPAPIPVEAVEARRGPLLVTVDEEGRTRVKDRYVVSAPVMGNLARIELRPGDPVVPGQVVARLVPLSPPLLDARTRAEAEARVAAAEAARQQADSTIERARTALQFAEREAGRQRTMSTTGVAPPAALERAEFEERTARETLASVEFSAKVADHDLQMARAALGRLGKGAAGKGDQLDLTSPVKGRVLRVIQESEGVVQLSTPLLEIADPTGLEIVVAVLTSDATRIEPGAHVEIERWGGSKPLRAHVRTVEPSAFTRLSALGVEEQRVNVLLDLDTPAAEWSQLGDGYRVEARIAIWESKDALTVPASAVFRRGEEWAVFKIQSGVVRVTTIEVAQRNPERVEVKKGLSPGDLVVGHPSDRLADGMAVEVL